MRTGGKRRPIETGTESVSAERNYDKPRRPFFVTISILLSILVVGELAMDQVLRLGGKAAPFLLPGLCLLVAIVTLLRVAKRGPTLPKAPVINDERGAAT